MATKPIPDGYHTVTPYLIVDDAQKLIDFLKRAFDAKETFCMKGEGEKIRHAEVLIGDSIVMISDANPQWKARSSMIYLYVEDVDAVYKRALQAGATSIKEPENQFYGDRSAGITDPVENYWGIATHVEDVSPEELAKRSEAFAKECAGS
jgi:PhnB protein